MDKDKGLCFDKEALMKATGMHEDCAEIYITAVNLRRRKGIRMFNINRILQEVKGTIKVGEKQTKRRVDELIDSGFFLPHSNSDYSILNPQMIFEEAKKKREGELKEAEELKNMFEKILNDLENSPIVKSDYIKIVQDGEIVHAMRVITNNADEYIKGFGYGFRTTFSHIMGNISDAMDRGVNINILVVDNRTSSIKKLKRINPERVNIDCLPRKMEIGPLRYYINEHSGVVLVDFGKDLDRVEKKGKTEIHNMYGIAFEGDSGKKILKCLNNHFETHLLNSK